MGSLGMGISSLLQDYQDISEKQILHKINSQLMLSIAMDSIAYSNNLNPNLPLTISPFVINTLDLMEKGGSMKLA